VMPHLFVSDISASDPVQEPVLLESVALGTAVYRGSVCPTRQMSRPDGWHSHNAPDLHLCNSRLQSFSGHSSSCICLGYRLSFSGNGTTTIRARQICRLWGSQRCS
jgi:hypothetical protein